MAGQDIKDPLARLYPPLTGNPIEDARMQHSRLRRRVLEDTWEYDVRDQLRREIEDTRADAWGQPDFSMNIGKDTWIKISALYDQTPKISAKVTNSKTFSDTMSAILKAAKWTSIMQAFQPYVVAQREAALRYDIVTDVITKQKRLMFTIIPADLFRAWPLPGEPDRIGKAWHYILRDSFDKSGEVFWTVDEWDISDPNNPSYRVLQLSSQNDSGGQTPLPIPRDVSAMYLGTITNQAGDMTGDAYPFRNKKGPFIPVTLYHARTSTKMWDPWYGRPLVDGSISVCIFYSFWRHCFRDASWPQRNVCDMRPAGGVVTSDRTPNAGSVTTDPSNILVWTATASGTPMHFQFQPGGDPVALANAITEYATNCLSCYDISPAEVQRVSADPKSGYAISLSREGIRKQIAKYRTPFEDGDLQTIANVAALCNLYNLAPNAELPEDPENWQIFHEGLPLSPEERALEAAGLNQSITLGVASKIDAYMQINNVTREEAIAGLRRVIDDEIAIDLYEQEQRKAAGLATPPTSTAVGNQPLPGIPTQKPKQLPRGDTPNADTNTSNLE